MSSSWAARSAFTDGNSYEYPNADAEPDRDHHSHRQANLHPCSNGHTIVSLV